MILSWAPKYLPINFNDSVSGQMVPDEGGYVPLRCTIANGTAEIGDTLSMRKSVTVEVTISFFNLIIHHL
jgi:hypothetical protein